MLQDHTKRKFEMANNTVNDLMPGSVTQVGSTDRAMAMVIIQCSQAIATEIAALREAVVKTDTMPCTEEIRKGVEGV